MTLTFQYDARSVDGKKLNGLIDAGSEREAIEALGARQLLVVNLKRTDTAVRKEVTKKIGRVPLGRLAVFTRQMAAMVRAGLPIMQCLDALARQSAHSSMKKAIETLGHSVSQGVSLSEAMAAQPTVFSNLYVSMVKAGETSGTLTELLDRLAHYLESSLKLRKKVRSAMTYPVIVTCMGLGITIFLVTAIIPVFADIYKEFGQQLPTLTQILITASETVRANLLTSIVMMIVTGFALYKLKKTPGGQWWWDEHKLRIPMIGTLAHNIALARFSRTMATMLRSGVPILDSCATAGRSAGNVVIDSAAIRMAESITEGQTLTEAMCRHALFPPLMQEMVNAGEQTGAVPEMLDQVATYYDMEIESMLSSLTALIEPLLIAFLGVVLGTVVVAMFLPIFNISQVVQF